MRSRVLLLLMVFALSCAGCAQLGLYAKDRALDFADMFTLKMHAGPGIAASAYFTEFFCCGFELVTDMPIDETPEDNYNLLLVRGRDVELVAGYECYSASLCIPLFPAILFGGSYRYVVRYGHEDKCWEERAFAFMAGQYAGAGEARLRSGNATLATEEASELTMRNWNKNYDRHMFGVGFCAHALIFGVSFEFSFEEFIDFLLGLATLDIMGDDSPAVTRAVSP
jgi:hypothetical protein